MKHMIKYEMELEKIKERISELEADLEYWLDEYKALEDYILMRTAEEEEA